MNLKIKFELEETELNGEIENLIPSSSGGSLPSGGTTGQVLTKNSNSDGDAGWKEPYTYVLPAATAETLGGVKIGNGINIAEDGTISSEGGGSASAVLYTEQTLTDEQKTQALANIGGLSKNQGTANSGKFLGIGANGVVVPTEVGGGSEWVTLFNGTIATEEAVNSMSADLLKSCEGMNEFLVWYTNTKNTVETPGNDNSEVAIGKANYSYGRFGDLTLENEKIVHLLLTDDITYSYVIDTKGNSMQFNTGTGTGGWSSNKANPDYNKVKISCFSGTYIGTITLKIYGR